MKHLRGITLACLAVSAGAASVGATAACEPRDLGFGRAEAGWSHQPPSQLKRDTVYTLAQAEGRTVLRAAADRSASAYAAYLKPPPAAPTVLSWRWKTGALVPGADNRDKAREDAPLRVLVAFDGDVATLPDAEQKRARRAKQLPGKDLPYGAEPGPVLGVGVMTDTDNTGAKAAGEYADLRFECTRN